MAQAGRYGDPVSRPPFAVPQMCSRCGDAPVQVCDECRRACALKSFDAISRHPESMTTEDVACLVCEDGPASWCGICWAEAVAEQRTRLRDTGAREIGRWPDYPR